MENVTTSPPSPLVPSVGSCAACTENNGQCRILASQQYPSTSGVENVAATARAAQNAVDLLSRALKNQPANDVEWTEAVNLVSPTKLEELSKMGWADCEQLEQAGIIYEYLAPIER